MSAPQEESRSAASVDLLVDRLRDRFESEWHAANDPSARPRIEDFAAGVAPEVSVAVVRALLEIEIELRLAADENLNPAEYLARFPEQAFFVAEACHGVVARENIPGFRVLRRIGGGGVGEVFLARWANPEAASPDRVAVKTIRSQLVADPLHRRVMENDILIASAVRSPHIVPILHVGASDGPLFYVMPYMHGGNLAQRIAGVPVPSTQAAELLLPIARAVAELHARPQPIVHLDLKPANVLLDAKGTPFLADFGLARLLGSDGATLITQGVAGTPEYMAPEQAEGHLGTACDIYGLGAILYELLTGRPPFRGATLSDTLRQVREQEVVSPRELNARVDEQLQALCLKCLEKNPKHRYASAAELVAELERFLAGEPLNLPGFWEWFARQLDRAVFFEPAASWASLITVLAVGSLIIHPLMFAMRDVTDARLFWVWNIFGNLLLEWCPWLLLLRRPRLDPREREMLLFWLAVAVGRTLIFAQFCPLTGSVDALEVYRYYPGALVLYGVMLFVEGRLYWGRLYLIGTADFVLALVILQFLPWAPLIFCVWHVTALLVIARHMRRIAAEHEEYAAGRQVVQ